MSWTPGSATPALAADRHTYAPERGGAVKLGLACQGGGQQHSSKPTLLPSASPLTPAAFRGSLPACTPAKPAPVETASLLCPAWRCRSGRPSSNRKTRSGLRRIGRSGRRRRCEPWLLYAGVCPALRAEYAPGGMPPNTTCPPWREGAHPAMEDWPPQASFKHLALLPSCPGHVAWAGLRLLVGSGPSFGLLQLWHGLRLTQAHLLACSIGGSGGPSALAPILVPGCTKSVLRNLWSCLLCS
jgi:hypothetical protein